MKIHKLVLVLVALALMVQSVMAEGRMEVENLIIGNWGNKEGEFGLDKTGKTELGYTLDFVVSSDRVYIMDSINNRIQIFKYNGKFEKTINLNRRWQDSGLPWNFTLYKDNWYMLIGKPPYYGNVGMTEVSIYDLSGKFKKSFRNKHVSQNVEEYFNAIFSDPNNGYIYCELGGAKILTFDGDGNFKGNLIIAQKDEILNLVGIAPGGDILVTAKSQARGKRTIVIDGKTGMNKEVRGKFNLADAKGNFLYIHTVGGSKRRGTKTATMVDVHNSKTGQTFQMQLSGDIKYTKNGKIGTIRYDGPFLEKLKSDSNGDIFHLIAFEDGVVLRRLSFK